MGPWLWVSCLTVLVGAAAVAGDPILGPDLNTCQPLQYPVTKEIFNCCLLERPIVDFEFPPGNSPMKIRRPAHKVDHDFMRKYERAYEIMRSLPPTDPRSHKAQSDIHCIYAGGAYNQFNSSERYGLHGSWVFFPFHRWYAYFHERILGSLIGDDTFALPYWAWDVQYDSNANTIPYIFLNPNSSLYDSLRTKSHRPPSHVDLQYWPSNPRMNPIDLVRSNLHAMWRLMLAETQTPELFMGDKYVKGDTMRSYTDGGRFEQGPHFHVHLWTGDETTAGRRDMLPIFTAARDPIFFSHHSQVDRLWLLYSEMGGRGFDDPDLLDSEILLYDENSNLVRVQLGDSFDLDKLHISYEQIPVDWANYVPISIRQTDPRFSPRKDMLSRLWVSFQRWTVPDTEKSLNSFLGLALGGSGVENVLRSRPANQVLTTKLRRPEKLAAGGSVLDEVLILEGEVTKPSAMAVLVHVFMELPEADGDTPRDCAESLGSLYFDIEGSRSADGDMITTRFSQKIGIGPRFHLLGIQDSTSVTLTFVPSWRLEEKKTVVVRFTKLSLQLVTE